MHHPARRPGSGTACGAGRQALLGTPSQPSCPTLGPQDRAAIRKAIDSFAKTFEARDAKALAGHFTTEGEFQNVQGAKLRGREALELAFAEFFSKTPEVTAEVRPESLRFLSRDSGDRRRDGHRPARAGEPGHQRPLQALVVRESEGWRLAQLSESPAGGQGLDRGPRLAHRPVEIDPRRRRRDPGDVLLGSGKKFIHVQFMIKEKNLALSGRQVIGVDPETGLTPLLDLRGQRRRSAKPTGLATATTGSSTPPAPWPMAAVSRKPTSSGG